MKKLVLSQWVFSLILVSLILAACGATAPETLSPSPTEPLAEPPTAEVSEPSATEPPTQPPMTEAPAPVPRGKCGDGVCDGPETAQNCAQDCADTGSATDTPVSPTDAPAEQPSGPAAVCLDPNPQRAIVSEELLGWYNWLHDGGFETGEADVVLSPLESLSSAKVERSREAARSGSFGYAIEAGAGEGIGFSIRTFMEKGENTRFSFWAQSPDGEVPLQPVVYAVPTTKREEPYKIYDSDETFTVDSDWTMISFDVENGKGLSHALLSLEIGPGTTLYLDDAQVEFPQWKMAEYTGPSRVVGGIPVPPEPAAPVHVSFLIHIEDPPQIQVAEEYFQTKTAVFRELAQMFHKHGGFLTIQPEEDWVMAANTFDPDLLGELAADYDTVYSTHTHGPHCRDDEGRLRSLTDCSMNRDTAGWDQSITAFGYPWVIEYVGSLRDLISAAAGTPVTDHNGNWEFDQASRFAEIPMLTWSAYKNHTDQRTYDVLMNNPWRPSECVADVDIETFLTHDPDTPIVYVPGWGQALTRHHERAQTRIAPMVSQFIRFADPDRVNTFYVVMHVDHFYSRADDPAYITYDANTGNLTYSAEFQQHLQYWDDTLTELIDPLVAEGYLEWTSLPEIGEFYREWEANCGLSSAEAAPATRTVPKAGVPPEGSTTPEAPLASKGRCGDGVCDGPENAQNCAQDCGSGTSPAAPTPQGVTSLPATGEPDYEPPINVFMILHIDPGRTTDDEPTFQADPVIYQRTKDEIDWLLEQAEGHSLRFTALYNGWYPKWALESGDLGQFQAVLDAGHEIGTHAHRLTYDPATDLWTARVHELSGYGRPNYDHDLARQAWDDADRYVDEVLAQLGVSNQNHTMCSLAYKCSTEGDLMDEFGFSISPGSRAEKSMGFFGHLIWNPWRPAASDDPGHELEEDVDGDFLLLDHVAQVGIPGGAHGQDLTIPQMQRRFLMLYLEWLSRERRGVEDRVWTWGFVFHPEDGDIFNDALTEFLTWLDDNFVGKTSPHGNTIARYATAGDIAQEYQAWEAEYPGVSSFSYVAGDSYPYSYAIVPGALEDAAYGAAVDLGPGINCHRLSRDGQPIYVLWSDQGEREIDFSGELGGQVSVTYASGEESQMDSSELLVTEDPLFVEPIE